MAGPVISGLLASGTPAVHQGYEKARVRPLVASGASVAAGDLVYLDGNGRVNVTGGGGSALQGASFLGVSQDSSPTIDPYHSVINPGVTVLVGGVALVSAVSASYHIGQLVYLTVTQNVVSSSAAGTSVGVVTSPFGTYQGQDWYANALTQIYIELAHPLFPV